MYSRFTALEGYGEKELERLKDSRVAVVGVGATGSAMAENLARHGVELVLIDRDYLEEKDVYSSSLYTLEQCRKALPKAEAAATILEEFTRVDSHVESLDSSNLGLVSSVDLVMDGTDNLETRQLINDFSKRNGTPWIYTAAIAERAYSMLFDDKCFNCLVEDQRKVATCETEGVMREVAQSAAAASSRKAVEYLAGKEPSECLEQVSEGRCLDVESGSCKVCGGEEYPHLSGGSEVVHVCGEGKYQIKKEVEEEHIRHAEEAGEKIAGNKYLTRILYNGYEVTFFRSGRVIAEAENRDHARAVVSELAGI
ncbi:MAG: ThiF family adenylyltransferase [Candidatus Nanohalobium sp.]